MTNKTKQANNYDILNEEEMSKIEKMINKLKKNSEIELEVSFRNINYPTYMRVIQHYINMTTDENITSVNSLDISILMPDGNTYRVGIMDEAEIDTFTKKYSKSNVRDIQKYLQTIIPGPNYELMFKDRGSADKIYIENFNILFKATSEIPIKKDSEKPNLDGKEKILYRYKERVSFMIDKYVKIDITNVKESPYLINLGNSISKYEIELEVINDKITTEILMKEVYDLIVQVQDTQIPIGKEETENVIKNYRKLFNLKANNHLDTRNVISIQPQYIVDFIPNRYAATDKADGMRYYIIILPEGIYMISLNFVVKKLAISITNKKYHNTVLDGEYFNNEHGIFFLVFDVVYFNGIDYRSNDEYPLTHRIKILNEIIDKFFGTLIPFTDYMSKNEDSDLEKIRIFYIQELKKYWKLFCESLKGSDGIFITRKVYFVPYGIDSSEVFMYADMIYKLLVYNNLTPYTLDGIIYTPINAPYLIKASLENLDNVPLEYKWKSPSQNSIDFYIKFDKNNKGEEIITYDNSITKGEGKAFKSCTLYVGLSQGNEEKPVPFKINGIEQKANIYLSDGATRDVEDNVISDSTVVEFVFDNKQPNTNDAYKWIPLRTRYDKTESVQKYRQKYGNNLKIASRIWKTIINPITEENIASLANPLTYQKEIERLKKMSSNTFSKKSYVYYEKISKDASGMRAFHNWIKNNMILTYCNNKQRVLDIGCGRGGDLRKFVHANVGEYVGTDIDNNGLYVINGSAVSRYNDLLKQKNKKIPPMHFINADSRGLFTVSAQSNIIPNMSSKNKELIKTYLSGNKKYNVVNCQFTLHYYLSDPLSWKNFCTNLNNHMEHNSYFLITCFDGKYVYDKLKDKQSISVSYTDNQGQKVKFFEIIKIYSDYDKPSGIGMGIDFYNSLISNTATREYLVFPDFLEKSLKENCGMELVETDTFYNLFNLYKNYFTQKQNTDLPMSDISSKMYTDIRNYYNSLIPNTHSDTISDAALANFKFSMLNRYYIFKKTTNIDITNPARVVGLNQELKLAQPITLGKILTPYFHDNKMMIDPAKRSSDINKIYHSIRKFYNGTKPSVYLIKHTITENNIDDNNTYKKNHFTFSRVKEGSDPKTLLIYKSPEKIYHPVYYRKLMYNDEDNDNDNFYAKKRISIEKVRSTYLLDSRKIVSDLDVLVALSQKMHS